MKTFTNYAEKKAKQILNLLQGYTKGIRITAILILLLMGVSNAWADYTWYSGDLLYYDFSAVSDGVNWHDGSIMQYDGSGGGKVKKVEFSNQVTMKNDWVVAKTNKGGWSEIKFSNPPSANQRRFIINSDGKTASWGYLDKYIAGDNWGGIGSWSTTTKKMTNNNNGTYTINFTSITASAHEFKIVNYDTWTGAIGHSNNVSCVNGELENSGGNIKFTPYIEGNVTITHNVSTGKTVITCPGIPVTLDQQSGTGGTTSVTATYGAAMPTATMPTRIGYTFNGYFTATSGGTKYYNADGSSAKNWDKNTATTLYAQWTANQYSITYKDQGGGAFSGTHASGYPTKHTYGTTTTLKTATKDGYTFEGWFTNSGCTGSKVTSLGATAYTANITLYAKWTINNTYYLAVKAGDGISTVTGSTDPVTLGDTYAITATPKTGYTFSTWTANPAANATFGSATTANTTVTVKNGSVTVTASATENMSTLTTSNKYDAGNPSYEVPAASVNSIGYETTATVTATAAGNGYTFTGWTLTNCTRTDGGATDATSITVRSNGDSKAAEVIANYAEDLTSTYYVQGDNAGPFSEGWNANQNTMMKKHSGNANSNDVYWEIDVPQSKVTPNDNQWEFKIYNAAGSDDNKKWLGWGSGDAHYWLTKANNNLTLSTSGSNNIRFKPYLAGKYTFHLNYDDSSKPTLEVTWPVYNQLRISAANPADATNTGEFDMTGSGTYTVTRSLNANTTYTFKIVYDSEWYGASSGNLTRASSSKILSTSSNDLTIQTDIAGDYTFTFNSSDKKLDITYPTAYKVTYTSTYTGGTVSATAENNTLHLPHTEITFTATPKTGYTFKGWQDGNGTQLSITNPYTHKMTKDITINAVFEENTYNIAIVANPVEAAETLTSSPQSVGVEKVNISTTAKFTYKFDNWTATDGITITDASNPSTSITATKAGTVTANFTQLQPTTVYLKPNTEWKQSDARFAIYYWHDGQPAGWVDMTDVGCNRDYFVATIPAGYTKFLFARMDPTNAENKWDAGIDWNKTGDLTIPSDGKNLFTLPTTDDQVWNGATTTWGTYTPPTYTITINAPEAGSIAVTVGGNTTTVTDTPKQITNIAVGTTFTIAYTPNAGFELGHSEVKGIKEAYDGAGTYTVCGPVDITAHFVTEEDQVVYLRPNGTWLSDKAIFYAYVFNRYGNNEWIELITEETDYTGAYGCTIPAGYSNVIFVRINPTAAEPSWNDSVKWNQSVDYVIPVNTTTNRFIIGEKITAEGADKDKYQGSWEANNTPIYGIPGDWQGNENWAAAYYPLMGPDGETTVHITQTNDTLGFKVYHYPYGTTAEQWLGNNNTMVRGNSTDWTMTTTGNNCGLGVDIADDYVFNFDIRTKQLTVTYPELPAPNDITASAERVFEESVLTWVAGNGTEANPYQLYIDETARFTVTPLTEVAGLTAYYRFGHYEEQTANSFDFTEINTKDTTLTVIAYYKNAMGSTSDTVTTQTPYIKGLTLPFYLMTDPSDEINIDRVAAGENILVQFRSDAAATVGLYVKKNDEATETKITDITSSISYDYTYDVDNNIDPCILHFIAKSTQTVHDRIFEATANVAIYKNVIIKVNDPEGWVKNAYMWRDYSDAVLTQWPGDPVLQNFGTWRVFSVKYPYYDRFIVNDGKAEGATQTIDYVLPADDTCYELLDPENNGSDLPEDVGKYGLQVAECPGNLIVGDLQDTTIYVNDQIVVIPSIALGLGYSTSDLTPTVTSSNTSIATATMSGMNITIIGKAEGESTITVTYTLETGETATKTFKVTVEKKTHITIQVKVPSESGPESNRIGWSDSTKIYIRYWNDQEQGADIQMTYLTTLNDYLYLLEAEVPLNEDGETNFHAFYEYIDSDKARWRQTDNIEKATEDGCYIVTTTGTQNSYNRGITYEGVRCLADEYQIRVLMLNGKTYTSNIVGTPSDTLSFFAPGKNETGYKAGAVMLYINDAMVATIDPAKFETSGVYTANLHDTDNDITNVAPYTGNYYIRTWGTDGDLNNQGWESAQSWTDEQKAERKFTYFVSREGEFYNHYWVQAMNSGGYDGKDVSACVANDYNDDLAGKLLQDKHTDEYGDIKIGTNVVINVRFGYDPRTNYFGRAILQGSEYDTYLNIHCDNAYYDKDCTKQFPYGTSNRDNKMYDISTWVYQRDFYVPITNTVPSATLYVEATSPNTTKTVTDHLLGYVINEITGEATSTPIQKTVIGSGTTNGTYLIRVIYDFKTNRIITAWLPQGTIEVNSEQTLNADVLFVRQENNDVPQIQLAENGKIKSLESMFFAMELLRGDEDSNNRRQEQYWFTLPFDCKVGSISGVPGYMQTWGIQRYRGDLRAQKGWYAETPTFWEWLDTEDVMHAGEGYLLVFDKKNAPFEEIEVDKMDAEGNIIDGQKETISMMRLYFPSMTSGFDMQQQSAEQLTRTYENHTCTLKLHDRYLQDSNWKVIGTTSYNNAGITGYTIDTNPEYEELSDAPSFRYSYGYNWDNNGKFTYTYTPEDGKTATYNSFYGYMVQFAGTISWQPIMSETVPEGIAARRYVPANERTSFTTRLEIANAEGEKQDQTFVALDEKATTTFDQNLDLNKVMNSHKANIYTLSEGIPFAGNTLPVEKVTVPVGVRTETAGEYTFRMPDGTDGISVFLIDNQTGVQTNMLLDEYTITLDAGTCENRFYLAVDPDRTATSVENIGEEAKGEEAKDQIKKFLIDGKLFIRTADGIFDAKGQRL